MKNPKKTGLLITIIGAVIFVGGFAIGIIFKTKPMDDIAGITIVVGLFLIGIGMGKIAEEKHICL